MHDAILPAKKLLYCELAAAKGKKNMLSFVIFSSSETPVICDAVSATLASKVNKISQNINAFTDLMTCALLNVNSSNTEKIKSASISATYNFQSIKPLYAVVLKNGRQDIRDPRDHKQFNDSICKEA